MYYIGYYFRVVPRELQTLLQRTLKESSVVTIADGSEVRYTKTKTLHNVRKAPLQPRHTSESDRKSTKQGQNARQQHSEKADSNKKTHRFSFKKKEHVLLAQKSKHDVACDSNKDEHYN